MANARSNEGIRSKLEKTIENYGLTVDKDYFDSASLENMPSSYVVKWVSTNIVSSAEDFAKKTTLVTIDDVTSGSSSLKNPNKEAKNLAHMLSVAVSTIDEMESLDGSSKLLKVIGPVLDAMSATETFGQNKTGVLLTSIFQSEKVRKDIGFSYKQATDTCLSIVDGASKKGYAQMMNSLGNMVEVIEKASKSNDIKEQVDELMKDLTPESAAVIGTATTAETVKNYGVPEQSAEPVSSIVSDMFVSLGDAKDNGMSDEEYEAESQAVTHVMNVMMSANENSSTSKSVFGEDSATGVEADAFINDVLSSSVVSGSVLDSVYGDSDEPTVDPLKLEKQLSEKETNDVVSALNDQWLNASAEEKQDGTFEKKIIAIGAIINLNVVVSDSGVVVA